MRKCIILAVPVMLTCSAVSSAGIVVTWEYDDLFTSQGGDVVVSKTSSIPNSGSVQLGINDGTSEYARTAYNFAQVGGFSTLHWTQNQTYAGNQPSYAGSYEIAQFKATTNASFAFTSTYNGLGTPGTAHYTAELYDYTQGLVLFYDKGNVTSHAGLLVAGDGYELNFETFIQNTGRSPSASASGDLIFSARDPASAPLPCSLALLATCFPGLMGLLHLRRRLKAA